MDLYDTLHNMLLKLRLQCSLVVIKPIEMIGKTLTIGYCKSSKGLVKSLATITALSVETLELLLNYHAVPFRG